MVEQQSMDKLESTVLKSASWSRVDLVSKNSKGVDLCSLLIGTSCAVGSIPCWATLSKLHWLWHTHTQTGRLNDPNHFSFSVWIRLAGWGSRECLGSVGLIQQVSITVLGAKTPMHTLITTFTYYNRLTKIYHPCSADLCFLFHSIYWVLIPKWYIVTMTTVRTSRETTDQPGWHHWYQSALWYTNRKAHFRQGVQSIFFISLATLVTWH